MPSIPEIASKAGGYLSLYKEDLDSLVWLLVRHRNHLTQRDLTLHLLSLGWDLDLDMIAFFLATLVSLEEGGKVTEEPNKPILFFLCVGKTHLFISKIQI